MTRRQTKNGNPTFDLLPLFEYSSVINSSIDLQFILSTVLLTVMGKMLVTKGMILLKQERVGFQIVVAKGVGNELAGRTIVIDRPSKTIIALKEAGREKESYRRFFAEQGQQLMVPILTQGKVVGLLTLGQRVGKKGFRKSEQDLIKSLVNLSASAIDKALMLEQLKLANRSLDRRYQELNTLFELSKEFNLVLDAQKVVRLLTFSLLGQVGVNRYAICLSEPGAMKIVTSRLEEVPELQQTIQLLAGLENAVLSIELKKQKKLLIAEEVLTKASVRAVIPMRVQNQTKGLILLGERLHGGDYAKADLEFLYSLGNLAIISIENARLFKETLEKQRMEEELKIAREIQQGLLPQKLPDIPGYEIAAVNVSSKQVGGDYYDVVPRSDGEYVLAIGDVSGKGTPAALLMANVQAAMRALAPMGYDLREATARINDLTFLNTGGDKFITFFWGIMDTRSGQLRYVNAGHSPPFLVRSNGTIERLRSGGIILGVTRTTSPYEEGSVFLRSGDMLFLFTDGVSEAMNLAGEDFTEERLEKVVKSAASRSATEIISHVKSEVEAYEKGTTQSDDITMLVLKKTS